MLAPPGSWCPLLGEILDPPLSRDLANLGDFEPTLREALADLHSKILDARPPSRSNFLHFHTVYGEIWPNNRLAPPPPSRKSWIRCYEVMSHQCDSSLLDIYVSVLHSENVANEWYPWGLQMSLHVRSPAFSEMGGGGIPE